MRFKNVLLASDFDGTLADSSGKIPDGVISAIKYFMSEGGRFTVCTGIKAFTFTVRLISMLPFFSETVQWRMIIGTKA